MARNRKSTSPRRPASKVGLVEFRPADWGRWLEIAVDAHQWEASHDDWRQSAEEMAARMRAAGLEVVFVTLDPEMFLQWCTQHGFECNAETRSRYAAIAVGNIKPPS